MAPDEGAASSVRPLAALGFSRLAPARASYILFVDDDESNLIVWEAACSEQFKVLTANNAERAMDLLGRYEVGVVLADQRMPGVTGTELLERVRATSPDTIRMLITAYSDLGAAIDAINRGQVRRYLRKPCALPELRAELVEALDLYDLRRRIQLAERRLLLTERVYALGVVAAGLGRELGRPAAWIRDSVLSAQGELRALTAKLETPGSDVRCVRTKILQVEECLGRALNGAERVLDIARSVEVPGDTADSEPVELTDVLRLALKVVRGEIRHGTDVQLDIQPVPPVEGTSAKLSQVVLNLLVNAIDAVANRAPSDRSIVVRLFERDETVRLEVMDNGPCIEESDMDRLFDPFHVGHSVRSSGLGLAISRAIVEEAGGTLDVANRSDGGALFRVMLPRSARAAAPRGEPPLPVS